MRRLLKNFTAQSFSRFHSQFARKRNLYRIVCRSLWGLLVEVGQPRHALCGSFGWRYVFLFLLKIILPTQTSFSGSLVYLKVSVDLGGQLLGLVQFIQFAHQSWFLTLQLLGLVEQLESFLVVKESVQKFKSYVFANLAEHLLPLLYFSYQSFRFIHLSPFRGQQVYRLSHELAHSLRCLLDITRVLLHNLTKGIRSLDVLICGVDKFIH